MPAVYRLTLILVETEQANPEPSHWQSSANWLKVMDIEIFVINRIDLNIRKFIEKTCDNCEILILNVRQLERFI